MPLNTAKSNCLCSLLKASKLDSWVIKLLQILHHKSLILDIRLYQYGINAAKSNCLNIVARLLVHSLHNRHPNDPEHHEEGVVPPPNDPNAPGEMGRPVKIDNPSPDIKALIDEGWKNNAFNQYASDIISLHRSLPDPRDEW